MQEADSIQLSTNAGSRVGEFFTRLFDTGGFPARWECGTWPAEVGWLHIIADSLIFLAYAAIPASLAVLVVRRRDVPWPGIFWLFVAFILSCGLTHLVDATMFYHPMYRFLGLMKAVTAVVSLTTVVALVRVMPTALALPGLARANVEAQATLVRAREEEKKLLATRDQLEARTSQLNIRNRRYVKAMESARAAAVCWHADTGQFEWEFGALDLIGGATGGMYAVRAWQDALDEPNYAKLQAAAATAAKDAGWFALELDLKPGDARKRRIRLQATAAPIISDEPPLITGMFTFIDSKG